MFIQTEETPNPLTLKFLPGQTVLEKGTKDYSRDSSYTESPLAIQLFKIAEVKSIFLKENFISVTKTPTAKWSDLKLEILTQLTEFFLNNQPVVTENSSAEDVSSGQVDPVSEQIRILLEEKIRPAVAQDGGDIIFDHFQDGIVYLKMQGACVGCPSSTATLKSGIENMLRHYVPEVQEVRAL